MKAKTTSAFDALNPQQRRAATFGTPAQDKGISAGPLLILAGAGTGKTNTLAHRTAHLVLNGVDPARILMLTFTRRAAQEMIRRTQTIVTEVLADRGKMGDRSVQSRLLWSGTFHSVGNRILRLFAKHLGFDPSFTVLDRADAADLIDVIRHELGFSAKDKRFPRKDACLAIYSYRVNTRLSLKQTLEEQFPWVLRMGTGSDAPVPRVRRPQAKEQRAGFRRSAALLARDDEESRARAEFGQQFRPCAGRRIPGHQRAAGRDHPSAEARRQRRHRGRRRRAGHLFVPRRGGREHPGVRGSLQAESRDRGAGAELPLDPADSRWRQCAHGGGRPPAPQDADRHAPIHAEAALRHPRGRAVARPNTLSTRSSRRARSAAR